MNRSDGGAETVAVLGGRGMLGHDVCRVLAAAGWTPVVFDVPQFDIRDEAQVRAVVAAHSVVLNCAAYTNVEKAESEPELAFAVNGTAVGMLGRLAADVGGYVVHISTDFVFDGDKNGAYGEDDAPNPLSAYGSSKLDGERRLTESGCSSCIVRVQWTYGAGGVNFVEKIRARAASGGALRVVDDQVGSPTWTRDVAVALSELIERRITGVYHYASSGAASRYAVACRIVDVCGYGATVDPCSSAEFPSAARRPGNSVFDCRRIDGVLSCLRPAWETALLAYLDLDV